MTCINIVCIDTVLYCFNFSSTSILYSVTVNLLSKTITRLLGKRMILFFVFVFSVMIIHIVIVTSSIPYKTLLLHVITEFILLLSCGSKHAVLHEYFHYPYHNPLIVFPFDACGTDRHICIHIPIKHFNS